MNLIFNKFSEETPPIDKDLLVFKNGSTYGSPSYTVVIDQIGAVWEEFDDEDYSTGSSICYDEEDKDPPTSEEEGVYYKLTYIYRDGSIPDDNDCWTLASEVDKMMWDEDEDEDNDK